MSITEALPSPFVANEEPETKLSKALDEIFEARPVCILSHILEELQARKVSCSSLYAVKKGLIRKTYVFRDGPFKNSYVKLGYDPRKDEESMKYQVFQVSTKNLNFEDKEDIGVNKPTFSTKAFKLVQIADVLDNDILLFLRTVIEGDPSFHVCLPGHVWMVRQEVLRSHSEENKSEVKHQLIRSFLIREYFKNNKNEF